MNGENLKRTFMILKGGNMQTHKPDTKANSASNGELILTNKHTEYTKCASVECSLYPDSNRAKTSSSSPGSWMRTTSPMKNCANKKSTHSSVVKNQICLWNSSDLMPFGRHERHMLVEERIGAKLVSLKRVVNHNDSLCSWWPYDGVLHLDHACIPNRVRQFVSQQLRNVRERQLDDRTRRCWKWSCKNGAQRKMTHSLGHRSDHQNKDEIERMLHQKWHESWAPLTVQNKIESIPASDELQPLRVVFITWMRASANWRAANAEYGPWGTQLCSWTAGSCSQTLACLETPLKLHNINMMGFEFVYQRNTSRLNGQTPRLWWDESELDERKWIWQTCGCDVSWKLKKFHSRSRIGWSVNSLPNCDENVMLWGWILSATKLTPMTSTVSVRGSAPATTSVSDLAPETASKSISTPARLSNAAPSSTTRENRSSTLYWSTAASDSDSLPSKPSKYCQVDDSKWNSPANQ